MQGVLALVLIVWWLGMHEWDATTWCVWMRGHLLQQSSLLQHSQATGHNKHTFQWPFTRTVHHLTRTATPWALLELPHYPTHKQFARIVTYCTIVFVSNCPNPHKWTAKKQWATLYVIIFIVDSYHNSQWGHLVIIFTESDLTQQPG